MKIAIFESITTPGGHEVDFDRILVEELTALGHKVSFCVPENFSFNFDYKVPVRYLPGDGVSYTGIRGLKKTIYALKREWNRQRWFGGLYKLAQQQEFDAIIVPTSTYRYLRALNINKLRNSPIPVIFIMHGINPQEAPRFFTEVEKLRPYPNIKAAVLTFGDSIFGRQYPNVNCINPPAYTPRDIEILPAQAADDSRSPLVLGFFGQYRREKKLDVFLDAFVQGKYIHPVKLLVQGATMNPDDSEDFERIIKKYSTYPFIEFLHKGLFGNEWQQAIAGIDALLMPYSAPRYRYHWGGMLFTAIGYKKPVVVSDEINPEVTAKYEIGITYPSGDSTALLKTVEKFINTYPQKAETYARELDRAYSDYHPRQFALAIAALAEKR